MEWNGTHLVYLCVSKPLLAAEIEIFVSDIAGNIFVSQYIRILDSEHSRQDGGL